MFRYIRLSNTCVYINCKIHACTDLYLQKIIFKSYVTTFPYLLLNTLLQLVFLYSKSTFSNKYYNFKDITGREMVFNSFKNTYFVFYFVIYKKQITQNCSSKRLKLKSFCIVEGEKYNISCCVELRFYLFSILKRGTKSQ